MSNYIFAALVPVQDKSAMDLRSYLVNKFSRYIGVIINYRASDETFILTINNIKLYIYLFKNIYNNTIILTKIYDKTADIYLNLHKIIAIKFYQFCMMVFKRVSLLNIDIIKNISSFIDFNLIQPPVHNRCLQISPLLLDSIIRVLSEQDKKNIALNQVMLNLPSPRFSCSICDRTCSICRNITFDADAVISNIMY